MKLRQCRLKARNTNRAEKCQWCHEWTKRKALQGKKEDIGKERNRNFHAVVPFFLACRWESSNFYVFLSSDYRGHELSFIRVGSKTDIHSVGESVAKRYCTGVKTVLVFGIPYFVGVQSRPLEPGSWSYAVRRSYLTHTPTSTMHSACIAEMAMHNENGPVYFGR